MIVFLHTASVHVPRFDALVRQYDKVIPIRHVINEDLLTVAMHTGYVDADGFKQTLQGIKTLNPSLIICTCSINLRHTL